MHGYGQTATCTVRRTLSSHWSVRWYPARGFARHRPLRRTARFNIAVSKVVLRAVQQKCRGIAVETLLLNEALYYD